MAGQTSRVNGRRSRGPVTPQGRARSSRNARRHGLAAPALGEGHGERIAALAAAFADPFAGDPAVAEAALDLARAQADLDRARRQDVAAVTLHTGIREEQATLHATQGARLDATIALERDRPLADEADPRPHRRITVLRMALAQARRRIGHDPGDPADAARAARFDALADRAVHARYRNAALAACRRARRRLETARADAAARLPAQGPGPGGED